MKLIPFFGPVVGTAICLVAALTGGSTVISQSPVLAGVAAPVLFYLFRGFIVGNFVYLRVVGRSVGVPGVIALIALSFFGALGGLLGMFLSPILAALFIDLSRFVHAKMNSLEPFPDEPDPQFMFTDVFARH